MTITVSEQAPRMAHGFDYTKLVLYIFAAVLVMLIVLPMSWLIYYSVVDKAGHFTLDNFATLVSEPEFRGPMLTTLILATSAAIFSIRNGRARSSRRIPATAAPS